MIDKQFDDILKRKLTDMTDASKSDWSAFEQKLDNTRLSSNSSEGKFDDAIKQKLAGMTAASNPSDWSTFEHMLDEDQLTDQMLDDKVSMEMNNMRAPYRQDHWELLHNSLEFQKLRNRRIVGFKILELSLLFILILSVNNFYKYLPTTFQVEKPIIYAKANDASKVNDLEIINNKDLTSQTQTESTDISNDRENKRDKTRTTALVKDNSHTASNNKVAVSREIVRRGQYRSTADDKIDASQTAYEVQPLVPALASTIGDTGKNLKVISTESITTLRLENITNQEPIIRVPLDKAARYTPYIVYPRNNTSTSLLLYAGLDNNLVNSPFDDVYDTEGFRTYGIGFSAGIEFGFKKDKKEFAVGLGYSHRGYEPRIIEELTGNPTLTLYETSLDHIEFNILSLSAGLKYMLLETDRWALDLGIGASANVVVNSDYRIETRTIRDGKYISSRDGRLPFSDLDDKPLHDGIFERGSLKENIYLTTDISLGLHKQLTESTTFVLRPEYSVHSFSNGIGPNNDLINNLSLNIGVKYIL